MNVLTRPIRGQFRQNAGMTLATQVGVLFLTVANTAIIARAFGIEGKGAVGLALLVPSMLGLFLGLGISVANVYFAGSQRLDVPSLTANSVAFALLAAFAGAILIALAVATGWADRLLPGIPARLLLLAMLGLPAALLTGSFNGVLQGLQQIWAVNLVNLSVSALTLLLSLVLIVALRLGLAAAVVAPVIAGFAGLALAAGLVRRAGGELRPRWRKAVIRTMLTFGLRGYIGNVLQFFNYRLDAFIVNLFLGPAGWGVYGVSVALAEILWYLPNAVGFVIFPKAAAAPAEEMNRFTPRVVRLTVAATAVGAIALALTGRFLIELIYSSQFLAAYEPLLALLPGVVLLGGAKVLTNEIAGRGHLQYNSINSGIALLLTIILDLLLIPDFGVLGAAIASSVAYAVMFFTAIWFYREVSRRGQP